MAVAPTVRTTCPYCGVGCGVRARTEGDGCVTIEGDADHPANRGRLCSKGAALGETVDVAGRLLHPQVDGQRASWDAALDRVAKGFAEVIDTHGPDAVAFYVSGQLLTEDYYVANKLMKGFIGSANIDTNSRLCMAATVAGHKRAFGGDLIPTSYEDLDEARLLVLAGSNAAWCHPILFQRIQAAKEADPQRRVVVIDPRRTATCELADLHLPLRPGTDVILWNGLLDWLSTHGVVDYGFLERHTAGFGDALASARTREGVTRVAAACGLVVDDVVRFYQWFADTEQTVTLYSQGVHQSTSGTDKVNALLNCHLLTGRIGKPGAGPLSLTGQPNAMGGREVGGLATTLAAHMAFDGAEVDRVGRFWGSPRVASRPGLRAVELFDAVRDGQVRALWIACTNPVVSLPNADRVRDALARCPLVVVSECQARTDTTELAHVVLPAATWGEKDGTVTNSERRISRQRAFLAPPGEARPDWAIFCDVARRMGYAGFEFESPAAIFREHAGLSAFENDGTRVFDLSGLAGLDDAAYDALAPIQWPIGAEGTGTARLFEDGRFATADGRARFVAVLPHPPAYGPDVEFPLVLNTGRVRDQWHTMTRTGRSPRLSAHAREPHVEVHPNDADRARLAHGDLARITSPWGAMVARVHVDPGQRRGTLFAPIHWTGQNARAGRVGALVPPAVDPLSGQPESKHTPVRIERYAPAWSGFLILPPEANPQDIPPHVDHWVRVTGEGHVQLDVAGDVAPGDWGAWARAALGVHDAPLLELHDAALCRYRAAHLENGHLVACAWIDAGDTEPPRAWLASKVTGPPLDDADRQALLLGRAPTGASDPGPLVCACNGVRRAALMHAIRHEGCTTPQALGASLGAGTSCGSCLPELRALLATAGG
jgi:assimilatory nitrate reductase catalytic subunit